ncbi:methylamine utilization protein [Simiduia agarivorans]|nr:methylamine utilization protein [Simiduia agarivorans]
MKSQIRSWIAPCLSLVLAVLLPWGQLLAATPVVILDAAGLPLPDAVLVVPGQSGPAPAGPFIVDQVDLTFVPHVLVIPVGAEVVFPNSDRTRHHVYSFSAPNQFELKLYRAKDAPPVKFDEPGIVELGCNIHDEMKGYLFVTRENVFGVSDAQGKVVFNDLAAGASEVIVWHPAMGTAAPQHYALAPEIRTDIRPVRPDPAPKSDLRDRLRRFKTQATEPAGD